MRPSQITAAAAVLLCAVAGCGHKSPPANNNSQAHAFVDTLKSLPADQRASYMRQHPEGMQAVTSSRDKDLMEQFQGMMRASR